MGLSIVVRLRWGRYDAAALRPQVAEWPPAPARVFCALVASARSDADWEALSWLERSGLPEIWATSDVTARGESLFVVRNAISRDGGNQFRLGRSNAQRQRVSAIPADDSFAFVWPHAEPNDDTLVRLVRLAARVPYVGRSTSHTEVMVTATAVEPRPAWNRWLPTEIGTPGTVELGVPYPGYVNLLRDAHDRGHRSWEVVRFVGYQMDGSEVPKTETVFGSTYSAEDLIILGFKPGRVAIGGDEWLTLTNALRQAAMKQIADPLPPQVSGHDAQGIPHVAYLAIPDVGYRYSDGHLLGVAVALPQELSGEARRRLLRGVIKGMPSLHFGEGRDVGLSYDPDRLAPYGLMAHRWTRRSMTWVTATPMMLDRYPKKSLTQERIVAESLIRCGYPEPESVEILRSSPLSGSIYRPRRTVAVLDRRPRRPWVHCRITFPAAVQGIVLAGSMRYLGGGLFAPEAVTYGDR